MIKTSVAARVAAQLQGPDRKIETVKGRLGEFRVTVDGRDVYNGNRLLYPRTKKVVATVLDSLGGNEPSK